MISKKTISALSLVLGAVLFSGCSYNPVSVSTDYQPIDFGALKTYQWLSAEEMGNQASDLVDTRIRTDIDNLLAGKSFTVTESNPDFYVGYSVLSQPRVDVDQYQTYEGYAPGFTWGRGYGMVMTDTRVGHTETSVDQYTEGTLFIDILDPDKKIMWRGTGSRRIPDSTGPSDIDALVDEVTSATLENFPPPAQ